MEGKITVREAAGELGVSMMHVRRLIKGGELRAFRPLPRKTMVFRDSLDALIAKNNGAQLCK